MNLQPILCQHGRVTSWFITYAVPTDRVPAIEHCEQCNPNATPLDNSPKEKS